MPSVLIIRPLLIQSTTLVFSTKIRGSFRRQRRCSSEHPGKILARLKAPAKSERVPYGRGLRVEEGSLYPGSLISCANFIRCQAQLPSTVKGLIGHISNHQMPSVAADARGLFS